ncbi:hypothetical protein [Corynebacterium bovis]|uniref:hypothetical protein n=1 Tax=Corynebacterium bovis TaxID=36808 RepID=UPI0031397C59
MTSHEPVLSLREQLWSPVQNTAVWLGWWVHGALSADELIDAFHEVQGPAHSVVVDGPSGDPFDGAVGTGPSGIAELLRGIRLVTDDAPVGHEERPLIGLALAGPGDVPPLPAGTRGAAAVTRAGAGITVADADPDVVHVVVPTLVDGSLVQWTWYRCEGRVPPLTVFSPGEADELLREATVRAAHLVEAGGPAGVPGAAGSVAGGDVRLKVGTLTDFFSLPGLPVGVPHRAAQLMARADRVAAIVEVARASELGAARDPQLLPLSRAVRTARMTAVDYAVRELLRD